MDFDLVVRDVRLPDSKPDQPTTDIGVKDGRIAVVGAPGTLGDASRRVDATAKLVIPGGIDPHIHCSMPVRAPGRPDVLTDPPSQVSKAALHGGTTTLIDFVQCVHERTVQQSVVDRLLDDDPSSSVEGPRTRAESNDDWPSTRPSSSGLSVAPRPLRLPSPKPK